MSNNKKVTDSELEILHILWEKGKASVREVNEELNKSRNVGYTTTLKIMQLMHEKHILERFEEGKKHIYTALIKESSIQKNMLNKLLKGTFKGSTYALVMEALGNHKASEQELKAIKEFIEKIEGAQK
jgi:BlaI family penicillinase repressor